MFSFLEEEKGPAEVGDRAEFRERDFTAEAQRPQRKRNVGFFETILHYVDFALLR